MPDEPVDPRFADYARSGDRELRDRLIADNTGLAIAFARRYRERGVPREDLEQIALEALVLSVERFDPGREVRFSTYAARLIDGALKQHFRDRTWQVHVPRAAKELSRSVETTIGTMTQELGRSPTPMEVADRLGIGMADVTMALETTAAQRPVSIDTEAAVTQPSSSDDAEQRRVEAQVLAPQLLATLPDEQRRVVELRFLHSMTQSEIADEIGVSQMQVSRLLRRALDRLRETLAAG